MAGFFGIGDFTKEGKGVDKNAPKKRGVFAFFELFFRKFWRLVKLNWLYLLACVPTFIILFFLSGIISSVVIGNNSGAMASALGLKAPDMNNAEFSKYVAIVDLIIRVMSCLVFTVFWGAGPVTAGYTYILRNYAREEHAWLWSDFWQYTKENFKQAIVVLAVDLVAFVLMFLAYVFYGKQTGIAFYLKYVIMMLAFIYTFMHFYIYPMMVTFRLSLKNIYHNAFLFALAKLPLNVLVLAILLFIHIGLPFLGINGYLGGRTALFWIILVILELCILVSTSGFMVNFSVYPSIKKYMILKADAEPKPEQ